MPIKRNSNQGERSLEEYYKDISENSPSSFQKVGDKMLEFLQMINEMFEKTHLWGLTSHSKLVIQAEDSWKSKWYVIIGSIGTEEYYMEYLIPTEKAPWPGAMIIGQAISLKEARQYLLIAMNECEGWKGNQELELLLEKYK